MSKAPEISLIMSVYNGEDYLHEAISSILTQTFTDWELIIINDCSTDSTAEILKEFAMADARVKVHTNEVNLKLPSSLNKAITVAKGKYIARMDADDIALPDRLEKQYKFMEENPDISLSSCRFMTLKNGVIASGGCGGRSDREAVKALLLVTNPILHPGIIARADVIRKLGYDKEFTCTEDMELWTRFEMENYDIEILSEYLMIYRIHDKQITSTTLERQRKEIVKVQKRYFSKLLEEMDAEREEFYVSGIYFRENKDIDKFCEFFRWIKSVNRRTKALKKDALCYAMFENFAELRRNGLEKSEIIKALIEFGPLFLVRELLSRRKRAVNEGLKCIESARKIGLEQTGGTVKFPIFSKIKK